VAYYGNPSNVLLMMGWRRIVSKLVLTGILSMLVLVAIAMSVGI